MFSDPYTLVLIAIIAVIIGIIIWSLCFRYQMILIAAALVVFLLNNTLDFETIRFGFGSYNIYLSDILSVLLISVAVGRLVLFSKWKTKGMVLILGLGALLFVSWVRGTFIFGIENSTNSQRSYFYFFALLFYFSTLNLSQNLLTGLAKWIGLAGFGLILLAAIRWILILTGVTASTTWIAPNGWMIRVLSASATLFLLQFLIILFFQQSPNGIKKIIRIMSGVILFGMILVLQQRTVWIALAVAIIITILVKSKLRSIFVLILLFILVLGLLFFALNNFSIEDLSGTSLDFQNLNWRIFGWQALLAPERFTTPLDYFIGQPFGTGYSRYIQNSTFETSVSPHNFYLQTFLNIGGFGLLSLLLMYGILLVSLWRSKSKQLSQLLIILLSTQLVFYLTYAPSFEQGIIVGLAIIYVDQLKRKEMNERSDSSFNRP